MRRSISFIGIASVLAAALAVATSGAYVSADNSMTSSGSSMGDHMAYLIGSWNCSVALAAMMGEPATTDHGVLTFVMAPYKTIHSHVAASDYAQDSYYGYNPTTKDHWMVSADTQARTIAERSKDGVTFTGTSVQRGTSTPTRDTFTHPKAKTIRDVTEIEIKGAWTKVADATCTKM